MRPTDDIKQAFKELHVPTRASFDEKIETEILQAREHSSPPPAFRRYIMQSRIGKLATAAIVALVVMLGISQWTGSDSSNVAWGDVQEAISQYPTVTYTMATSIEGRRNRVYDFNEIVYNGGPMGMRKDSYMKGDLIMQDFVCVQEGVIYRIRNDRKTYVRRPLPEGRWQSEEQDPRYFLKKALQADYKELKPCTIKGMKAQGIETFFGREEDGTIRIWIDPSTNLPIKMEIQTRSMNEGAIRPMTLIMEDFEWDVAIDPALLTPNIPANYKKLESFDRPQNEQTKKILTAQEKAEQPKVKAVAQAFLTACSQKNWDEILKHSPRFKGLSTERTTQFETLLGGLKIHRLDAPYKTDDPNTWHVSGHIEFTDGEKDSDIVRIRYDETLERHVICGGP